MDTAISLEYFVYEENSGYKKHDGGYKSLLYNKRAFLEFLQTFVKESWVAELDENSIMRVHTEYVLQDFAGKKADVVYKVKIGQEYVMFYVLLELQSNVDFLMPYRLLLYMVEIWRDVFKNTPKNTRERKGFKFPCIIPMVLYNGKYNWTAFRSYREMISNNGILRKYIPNFEYILIDVNRYDEQELLAAGSLISSIFYMDQESDTEEIFRRAESLVSVIKTFDKDDLQVLRNWIKEMTCQGMPLEDQEKILEVFEKNQEVSSMISNLTKAIRDECRKDRKEGRAQGKVEGKAEIVMKLLSIKFGEIPRDMLEKIGSASEAQVQEIANKIFEIKSLDEVNNYLE